LQTLGSDSVDKGCEQGFLTKTYSQVHFPCKYFP